MLSKWGNTPDEVIKLLEPEKPTEEETQAAEKISPEDYSIYFEWLNMICEEAKETFVRSGITSMIRSGDLAVGIYTFNADMATGLCGTYIHAVTMTPAIKYILRRYKDILREGDVWFFNDPLYGACHASDEYCVMPIFSDGRLIAWSSGCVHAGDIGGCEPGQPVSAKSRYDEGLKISPVKIAENYQVKEDLLEAFGGMSRTPRAHILDIRARIAACDRIRVRIQEIAKEKGAEFVIGLLRKMIMECERGLCERVKRWNDGIYRAVAFLDALGNNISLAKVTLTLKKKGDHIIFDFSEGTSPENPTPYNCFGHTVIGHTSVALYGSVHYDLPPSSAMWDVHEFKFRKGSIFHANEETATILGTPLNMATFYLVSTVLSKMMFSDEESRSVRVTCGYGNSWGHLVLAGTNQWGESFADFHPVAFNSAAFGGRAARDGVDSAAFYWCPWGKAPDIEEVERDMPLLHLFHGHIKDSGGFGKYRGGASNSTVFMHYGKTPLAFITFGEGDLAPVGAGLFGGYPSRALCDLKIRSTDMLERLKRGDKNLPRDFVEFISAKDLKGKREVTHRALASSVIFPNDLAVTSTSGGSGYGDPLERDPDSVAKDVESGVISERTARNIYKVVYDSATLEVNYEETEKLRQQEREVRKKKGKKYEEWEKEWARRSPPKEFLQFYGSWPSAEPSSES